MLGYSTLAFGSALALFLYPHSVTGVLASRSRDTIKRNMAALPAYSLVLGLIALLGYMAIAAGIKPIVSGGKPDPNTIVPLLFDKMFPDWFAGVAFAAIGDRRAGARRRSCRSPRPTCSRATSTRSTCNRDATPAQEARSSKLASLVVKAGAVVVILRARSAVLDRPAADRRRDHPADAAGDRVRPVHPLLPRLGPARRLGRRAGGGPVHALRHAERDDAARRTSAARSTRCRSSGSTRRRRSTRASSRWCSTSSSRSWSTLIVRATGRPYGEDQTHPDDYVVEAGDPGVEPLPEPEAAPAR